MAQKKLLTNGTTSKCNDGRWHGTVWYLDEAGERKRSAFSGVSKKDVEKKMKEYTEHFYDDQQSLISWTTSITLKLLSSISLRLTSLPE